MAVLFSSKHFPAPSIGKQPPERILAFKWGLNSTKKGDFYLTKESAASIIDDFNATGNALVFDLEHITLDEDAKDTDKRALAYGPQLELDDIGLWVCGVVYTTEGHELIASGKWGWVSPVFFPKLVDSAFLKKEINKLKMMAFTNQPATNHARPVLLSNGDINMEEMLPMNNELISKVKPLRDMQNQLGTCLNIASDAMNTHADGPIRQISQKMSDMLPEWISIIGELLENMDPEGITKSVTVAPDVVEDVSVTESTALSSSIAPQDDMLETLVALTAENEPEKIKGKLLALSHNLKIAEQELADARLSQKALLVDAAIAQGKIPPGEKQRFISLSMDGIQSYLSMAKSKTEVFTSLSQKQEDVTVVDMAPIRNKQIQEDVSAMFKNIKR